MSNIATQLHLEAETTAPIPGADCPSELCVALLTNSATVAAWIARLHASGMKASSIDVKVSAITYAHREHGHEFDRRLLRKLMGGIRREAGSAVRQVPALMIDDLKVIIDHLDMRTLSGVRDRSLLLLGFSGALRRSELVGLDVAAGGDGTGHIKFVDQGVEITLRRSKSDQLGEGQVVAIPFGGEHCAVRALGEWIEEAEIDSGPLFRRVDRHDIVGSKRMDLKAIRYIVKRRSEEAGIANADKLSAHSLRAGFATSAAAGCVQEHLIQQQTRHRSVEVLRSYIRNGNRFAQNALNGTDL